MKIWLTIEELDQSTGSPTGNLVCLEEFPDEESATAQAIILRKSIFDYHHCKFIHLKSSYMIEECYYDHLSQYSYGHDVANQVHQMRLPEVIIKKV